MDHRLTRRTGSRRILTGITALVLLSLVAATGAVGFSPSAAHAQADVPATAAVTPETSAAYFAISLDTASAQWTKTNELLERSGLGTSVEDLLGLIDDTGTVGSVNIQDSVAPFIGGEVAVVATDAAFAAATGSDLTSLVGAVPVPDLPTAETPASGASGMVIVALPDDVAAAWTEVEGELQTAATDAGVTVEESEYNGTTIFSVPGDPDFGVEGQAAAQLGDFILVSTTPEDFEAIIDTQAGTIEPISNLDAFNEALQALPAEHLVFGFLNGPSLATGLQDAGGSALGGVNLGGAGINQYTGVAVWADDPGLRIDTVTLAGEGESLPAAPENFESRLASRVPGDALIFVNGFGLGASGILDSIALLFVQGMSGAVPGATPVAEVSPEEYLAEQFAAAEQLLGFNLKTDFIDQLTGEYAFALWGFDLLDPSGLGGLIVSNVQTPTALDEAIEKIGFLVQAGGQGEANVTTKQVGESTVTVVDLSGSDLPLTIEYGVVDGQFILGIGTALEDYVAGAATDTLADSEGYQAALAALPAEHNAIFYLDLSQLVPLVQSFIGSFSADAFEVTDADPSCAEFSTQAAAQETYDADPIDNYLLDQDFDGQACEDYFNPATPAATPAIGSDFSALKAIASVSYVDDGTPKSSTIILIEE